MPRALSGLSRDIRHRTQFPDYGCANGSAGLVPSNFLFVLTVPRHFVAPSTQQWNFTVQRDLGKQWVLEVGYVGTHGLHLRETRTNIQAQTGHRGQPVYRDREDGTQFKITKNTHVQRPARSNLLGVNGYGGFQFFANDAYSHYHSLQATFSRRWGAGYFQGAYTFSKATDATSSGNTALNTAFNDESDIRNSYGLVRLRPQASADRELPLRSALLRGAHGREGRASGRLGHQRYHDLPVGHALLRAGLCSRICLPGDVSVLRKPWARIWRRDAPFPGSDLAATFTSGWTVTSTSTILLKPLLRPIRGCDVDPTHAACTKSFGTLHRNIYRGPFQQNWDFSLIKHFRLSEKAGCFVSRRTSSTSGTMPTSPARLPKMWRIQARFGKINSHRRHAAPDPVLAAVRVLT